MFARNSHVLHELGRAEEVELHQPGNNQANEDEDKEVNLAKHTQRLEDGNLAGFGRRRSWQQEAPDHHQQR